MRSCTRRFVGLGPDSAGFVIGSEFL
jgi:hypothetical protein